jgi:hypothetical protein
MKTCIYIFSLLFIIAGLSAQAQTVDHKFITLIVSQPDSTSISSLKKMGYRADKDGDFRFVADGKVKSLVSYVKANPDAGQNQTYWSFQARGKKVYAPILKEIKKGAQIKKGTHFGKPRTEYKSPEGLYYYPFEDSMFDGLYWIYASKESLLESSSAAE